MAQLSLETVKQAINILKSQGKKLTNRNIVEHLGYGSFSTLKKIREHHPELFSAVDTLSDTHQINSTIEKRILFLETSIQMIQQSVQWLTQDKVVSLKNLELQRQVEELTENLQEMYQLWRELTQQLNSPPPEEIIPTTVTTIPTTIPAEVSHKLPNPKQNEAFISWAKQQKERYQAWKPVADWLNQHQVFMLKGQSWNAKSLSDFIRKKRQKLKQQNFSEKGSW